MINTFYFSGALNSPLALLLSLLIGIAFGIVLELAGFGSSKRLSGIFYFKDMAVLKVMFSAVIVAMIVVSYGKAFGLLNAGNIYFLNTVYIAQIFGGLIFGIGFVVSGWCPGTGAVGLASGKIDALVFLFGVLIGSIMYNEVFPVVSFLANQNSGVVFAYSTLGLSEATLAFIMTLIAVLCFWGCEYIEGRRNPNIIRPGGLFLKVFSLLLIVSAFGLFAVQTDDGVQAFSTFQEKKIIDSIQAGLDHISPEELANRIVAGDQSVVLIDIRTPEEFNHFNIRTSKNIQLPNLYTNLQPYKNKGIIILYSNGMTHPSQAHDSLMRQGFSNVYILTDGIKGYIKKCLKPVSLRDKHLDHEQIIKINKWRSFFLPPLLCFKKMI